MYWFDTTLLALLAISALLGAWCGFLKQISRIICIGLAAYATFLFHEPTAAFLQECALKDAHPQVIDGVAHLAVFTIAFLFLHTISRLIRKGIRDAELIGYDRLLGAGLGACKMSLLLGVVCLGMMNYRHPTTEAILEKSKLADFFADGMERIVVLIPEEYKYRLREVILDLRDRMQ